MKKETFDKEAIKNFLLTGNLSQKAKKSIDKVITMITSKYAFNHLDELQDLKQLVYLETLERRSRYDPNQSAYNYFFTIARNTITNLFKKKRISTCEILPNIDREEDFESLSDDTDSNLEILQILGEDSGKIKRISRAELLKVVDLMTMNKKDSVHLEYSKYGLYSLSKFLLSELTQEDDK